MTDLALGEADHGLPPRTQQQMLDCFRAIPELAEVRLYGSRAMGNFKPGSDVDLAVWGDPGADVAARLHNLLYAMPTPYTFDVTDYATLSHQGMREHIDRVGKPLYRRRP